MPLGSNKESMFPESKWSVNDRSSYCKFAYNVVPRTNWITSEFGGPVSFFIYLILTIFFNLHILTSNTIYFHACTKLVQFYKIDLLIICCYLQDIEIVLKRSSGNIIFFNGLRDPWSGGG
jgi:lysosomal Pro-X carboxypeptidase